MLSAFGFNMYWTIWGNYECWEKWNFIKCGDSNRRPIQISKAGWLVTCVTTRNSDNGPWLPGHSGHQTMQASHRYIGPLIQHAGYQTLQASHRFIGPLIQQGLTEFMEVIWWMIQVVECTPLFVPQMFDGDAVKGLCRLVHFSDVLLLEINSHYSGTMKCSIVILVAKIILKVLPSKWYKGVPQDVPIHHAIDVPNQEHNGWFRWFGMPPRHGQNPLQLGPWQPGSLAWSVLPVVDEPFGDQPRWSCRWLAVAKVFPRILRAR